MYLFEEIENHGKNNIWPKLLAFLDTAKELWNKELLYFNSTFSYSGMRIKKIAFLILFALFSCIVTVFLICALIAKLILQSFPDVPSNYLLLGSAIIFSLFFAIAALIIKKQLINLKRELSTLITHFKGYDYESKKTKH